MEIKRIIGFIAAAAAVFAVSVSAKAADEVIYENTSAKAGSEAVDLGGWGYELFDRAVYEADVKFGGENSGITLMSQDNQKGGTSIRAVDRNGTLTMAAYGGVEGNYIYYNAVDTEKTYHIELIGTYGVPTGMIDMKVEALNEDGNVEETKDAYLILMNEMYASSGVGPEHIRLEANTEAKNIKVTALRPDSLAFSSLPSAITAGSETQVNAKFYREGSEIAYSGEIEYSADGQGISISKDGVLRANENAPEQELSITARCGALVSEAKISLVSGDIFTINTALFNEDGTILKAVNAKKNYYYSANAVFVVTVYNGEGVLCDCFTKSVPLKAVSLRKDEDIILDYTLPQDYDSSEWTIEINVWSESSAAEVPLPDGDIALRKFFEENGGAVEWIGEYRTVAGMLNGKTAVIQIDSENAFIDGKGCTLSNAPYISEDSTYIGAEFIELFR